MHMPEYTAFTKMHFLCAMSARLPTEAITTAMIKLFQEITCLTCSGANGFDVIPLQANGAHF